MSERYGECPYCNGRGEIVMHAQQTECGFCDGTGFDGNAMVYVRSQVQTEWERDKVAMKAPKEVIR